MLIVAPARADWCHKPGGGVEPCDTWPSSWTDCGTFQGETIWCFQSGSANGRPKSKNNMNAVLISVGAGVVFIAAMWYFFKMPKSSNAEGQVKLMEF